MTVLIGALTDGLILSLLALGVFISFRIFAFSDITPDGSITLGASVTAALLVTPGTSMDTALMWSGIAGLAGAVGLASLFLSEGKSLPRTLASALIAFLAMGSLVLVSLLYRNPAVATAAGFASGLLAGAATGILHTRFQINGLLAGILVMTALYSVNLRILGKSSLTLQSTTTLPDYAERLAMSLMGGRSTLSLFGWEVYTRNVAVLVFALLVAVVLFLAMFLFFRTSLGTAMRATGDCPQMIRALGVNVGNLEVAGLALSNGFVALTGSLYAQSIGLADVQMGIGMLVWGLASVILGEALVGAGRIGLTLTGIVMGSILFKQLVAIALRVGLNPLDLKLITAVFVLLALVAPKTWDWIKGRVLRKVGRSPMPHA